MLLAAGASTRLGRAKQLLFYKDKTLLQHTIDVSQQAEFNQQVLVLGANAETIKNQTRTVAMAVTINEAWKGGLSTSIKSGLAKLLAINPDCENVMFLLCDQPFLNTNVLETLMAAHREEGNRITVSSYDDQWGVPMIFPASFFSELKRLDGDAGAKKIVMQHMEQAQFVSFPKGNFDIDTEEDYQKLTARL